MSSNIKLPDDLQDLLNATSVFSDAKRQTLAKANKDLLTSPSFKADVLKSSFVEDIYSAMQDQNLSKSALAKIWGKTRQYVAKILDENAKINFTIETMAEISHYCGLELQITTVSKNDRIWKNLIKPVEPCALDISGLFSFNESVEIPEDVIIPLFNKQDWQKENTTPTSPNNEIALSA